MIVETAYTVNQKLLIDHDHYEGIYPPLETDDNRHALGKCMAILH